MKIALKLFASLGKHLPPDAERNTIELEVPERMTIQAVLGRMGIPRESVKLVFVDGVHQLPEDLACRFLEPGETLAVWPPVAGG
uniref:Mut7-C ubiquitin n=1 Tax=Candidatus Kentrum sp. LFY TaxID=2126342 RepID=A0A450UEM2_9GAMM|nr:MAG: Mut7-C ubiquitin [Candidatus Kentron sp. LFY]